MAWLARLFLGKKNKSQEWKEIEYFHDTWKVRIAAMANYLPESCSVMDLGSGKEWLRDYLKKNVRYLGVDYLDRGTGNLVCDFNKKQFPKQQCDFAFISGCLEYIEDPNWFLEQLAGHVKQVILSYNTLEAVPDIAARKHLAWKNHFSECQITRLFEDHQFALIETDKNVHKNTIYIFKKK
jgi:hypothetical protein